MLKNKEVTTLKNKVKIIILTFFMALSMWAIPVFAAEDSIVYDQNKNLTDEEINERFKLINSTYTVGEPFSEADAEFIKLYPGLHNASLAATRVTEKGFDKSKTGSGVTVNLYGAMYGDLNLVYGWYQSDAKLNINKGYTNVTGLTMHITCDAYGLLGSSGTYVGIVYKGDKTTKLTPGSKSYYVNKKYEFTGVGMVSAYTNTYIEVDTKIGSFNLYAF